MSYRNPPSGGEAIEGLLTIRRGMEIGSKPDIRTKMEYALARSRPAAKWTR